MRIAPLLALAGACYGPATARADGIFGTWKENLNRSMEPYQKSLVVRFEPHARGEVFTLERIDVAGRVTTSSIILYFDGKARDYQGFGCSGTQTSRRVDSLTVEILQTCANGQWTRFVRRTSGQPKELLLDVTEHQSNGRRLERRLLLEKQL